MSAGFPPGLLLVTDRRGAKRPLSELCRAALEGGFSAVMLREKDLGGRETFTLAAELSALCLEFGRPLIVNDRVDVALALDGVGGHVGSRGLPVAEARAILGPERLLGFSAHAVEEAANALAGGADYATLSPILPSASKPDLAPRGLAFLREALAVLPPARVIALGGIDETNAAAVRAAGAAGIAVMGAMARSDDPLATARRIVAAWEGGA